jgi:hypothetical protein
MKAMFANLTLADFRGRSRKERLAAKRKSIHAVFDEIQIAIHKGDRSKIDYLIAELADATADGGAVSPNGERYMTPVLVGDHTSSCSPEVEDVEGPAA